VAGRLTGLENRHGTLTATLPWVGTGGLAGKPDLRFRLPER